MEKASAWSEDEVRAAVTAYFKLLKSEQDGGKVSKAGLYRNLSARFKVQTSKPGDTT